MALVFEYYWAVFNLTNTLLYVITLMKFKLFAYGQNIYIYVVKVYRACTYALASSHSSPGVESNQSNVTCFDLIRSHQTRLLVRRQEVRENSQI